MLVLAPEYTRSRRLPQVGPRDEEWDEIIDSVREKVDIKRRKRKRSGILVTRNVRESERVVGCSHTTCISLPLELYLNPATRLFRPSFYPT